jgi:hypothetical protein
MKSGDGAQNESTRGRMLRQDDILPVAFVRRGLVGLSLLNGNENAELNQHQNDRKRFD